MSKNSNILKTALSILVGFVVIVTLAIKSARPLFSEQVETLKILLIVYAITAGLCFLVSELTRNYSQVDKLWSLMPLAYAWIIALQSHFQPLPTFAAILITAWGLRLTFNFARRGGYSWKFWTGEEDYRWEHLRQDPKFQNKASWVIFNLFFISYYQMGLILYFTLPVLLTWLPESRELNFWDFIIGLSAILLIVLETIADQQQYRFQTEKHRRLEAGEDLGPYEIGFIDTGLWGIVRHPNYAAEQAFWLCIYLLSVSATGLWINWTIGGIILLIILFKGSSDFSEQISAGKYPKYKAYIKRIPRFVPLIRF